MAGGNHLSDSSKTSGQAPRRVIDMDTPTLDALGIVTADMARSLAFYRRLGLAIPDPADREPHVEHALANGMRVMWDLRQVVTSFDPTWTPPTGGSRIGLAFRCHSASAVDAIYASSVAADPGVAHLEPFDAVWGQRYASLRDPDGNAVDLYAPLS